MIYNTCIMLALENKQLNSIFERIVEDKNGVLVRVRFTIIEKNGRFQGQIISAEPLISQIEKEKVLCLSCVKSLKVSIDSSIAFTPILSPYFTLEFLMSQPTRAPANR